MAGPCHRLGLANQRTSFPKSTWTNTSSLLKSKLMKKLNESSMIRPGYPVEGLLCGRSFQPIGESSHGVISAKLSFTEIKESRSGFLSF